MLNFPMEQMHALTKAQMDQWERNFDRVDTTASKLEQLCFSKCGKISSIVVASTMRNTSII